MLRISCQSPRPVRVCAIRALGARDDVASTFVNGSRHACFSVEINSFLLTAIENGFYCHLTDLLLLTDSKLTFYLTEIWFNRCRGKVTYRLTALLVPEVREDGYERMYSIIVEE